MILLFSLATIFGWGSWMAVSRRVECPNPHGRAFYATLSNLGVSLIIFLATGSSLRLGDLWLPFSGGVIWAVAGIFAFRATDRLGLARATGIWVSINIAVGLLWGAFLYGELAGKGLGYIVLLFAFLLLLLIGVLLMSGARAGGEASAAHAGGILDASIAGVLWGSYFIPVRSSGLALPAAALPMAAGMVLTSLIMALPARAPLSLARPRDYLKTAVSGALWAIANYSMLLLSDRIGLGKSFAIAQLNLAVSTAWGIYLFHEVEPGSPAFRRVVVGALVATLGAVSLGLVR